MKNHREKFPIQQGERNFQGGIPIIFKFIRSSHLHEDGGDEVSQYMTCPS